MADAEQGDLTTLTVQLLSAYVANNTVPANELAPLIETTRAALAGKTEEPASEPVAEDYPRPVSIKKSIASPDFIISMVDGKQYKMLKRHLATHGMTPRDYIERYKLPKNYPMVAPTYAEQRRLTAERIGLGRKGAKKAAQPEASIAAAKPAAPAAPKAAPKPTARKAPVKKAPAKPVKSANKNPTEDTPTAETAPAAKFSTGRKPAAKRVPAAAKPDAAKAPAKRARKPAAKIEAPAETSASE